MDKKLLPSTPKYKTARSLLITVFCLSIANIFTYFLDSYLYYFYSSHLSLILVQIGDLMANTTGVIALRYIFAAAAIIAAVPYLLCWIFSKKHVGWMIAALSLFSVDTLLLLIDVPSYIVAGYYLIIVDVLLHAAILVSLAIGVKAGFSIKKEEEELATQLQQLQKTSVPTEGTCDNDSQGTASTVSENKTRAALITRAKALAGCAVPYIIYVNGVEVCRLKNGESKAIVVPASEFILSAAVSTGYGNAKLTVQEGEASLSFTLKAKASFGDTLELTKN